MKSVLFVIFCLIVTSFANQKVQDFWERFDANQAPLNIKQVKNLQNDWGEIDLIRYDVGRLEGSNKIASPKMTAYFGVPEGATALSPVPAILHLHGGGQKASKERVRQWMELGYAAISINWGEKATEAEGLLNTDWDGLAAGFLEPVHHNAISGDENTLYKEDHLLNSSWNLISVAARRALTVLEEDERVDSNKLGVEGHSMGGRATIGVALDSRVKAIAPSVGGTGFLYQDLWGLEGSARRMSKKENLSFYQEVVSAQSYWPYVKAPTMFLQASNDFNAPMESVIRGLSLLPKSVERITSIAPHFNHRFTKEASAARFMWMEAHLKNEFNFPLQSSSNIRLDHASKVPLFSVVPDLSSGLKVVKVEVFYGYARDPRIRFWRRAKVEKKGAVYEGHCHLFDDGEPLFAFANISYRLPKPLPARPGSAMTDVLTVSSEYQIILPESFKNAGLSLTAERSRVIDDFKAGMEDWYTLNYLNSQHWMCSTRKVVDPCFMGPLDSSLRVTYSGEKSTNILAVGGVVNAWQGYTGRKKDTYRAVVDLGEIDGNTFRVKASDFKNKEGEVLKNWDELTELYFTPAHKEGLSEKQWEGKALPLSSVFWEGGDLSVRRPYPHLKTGAVSEPSSFDKEFQKSIKESVELERSDVDSHLKPNVLIIYADDIGKGDLSYYGQKHFKTPHIDRLIEKGVSFPNFYGCTVCAPARASLLTGRTNAHNPHPSKGGLECKLAAGLISKEEYTEETDKYYERMKKGVYLGGVARKAGYDTAYFGKLAIGYTETPKTMSLYGFDHHVGLYDSVICWGFYPEYYWKNGEKIVLPTNPRFSGASPVCPLVGKADQVYTEDVWLEECKQYLKAQSQSPFLAVYATQLPHGPASIAQKDFVYKGAEGLNEREQVYASMMDKLDRTVGELVSCLEECGLDENTIILFMGDNGHEPATYLQEYERSHHVNNLWDGHERGENVFNGTLGQRGTKRFNFEGGLKVPFVVSWPKVFQEGLEIGSRSAVYDVLPTLAEIMGQEINTLIDGVSLLPLLKEEVKAIDREYLHWINTSGKTRDALIQGDWKLVIEMDLTTSVPNKGVRNYKPALYHLGEDPYEKKDLSMEHPEKLAELLALVEKAQQPLK